MLPIHRGTPPRKKSPIRHVDLIIVGAGLAGSAMAWQAHRRNQSLAIIDRNDSQSASRVAAGLVTPITGTRGAASWRWNDFYPYADHFYRTIQELVSVPFWQVDPSIKIFSSEHERQLYDVKWIQPVEEIKELVEGEIRVARAEINSESNVIANHGACSLQPSARLATISYLNATRTYFESLGSYLTGEVPCDQIQVESNARVVIPPLEIQGERIVFCQGVAARTNSWFDLPLHPARGDILTVQSRLIRMSSVLHGETWVVPMQDQIYQIGATYHRCPPSAHSDDASRIILARNELIARFEKMVRGTFQSGEHLVLDQRTAIRPASYDRHPLLGQHPIYSNVYCLNGLGSKGSLMAPYLAAHLLDAMQGNSVAPYFQWTRRKV
jgi:glycine/D-amino acid oxidase-like deaminating enzyme